MIDLGYGWAEPPAFCSPTAYDVELAHAHVRKATLPAQYTRLMPQEPWLRAAAHFDLAAPGGTAFRFPELGDAGALREAARATATSDGAGCSTGLRDRIRLHPASRGNRRSVPVAPAGAAA